MFNSSLTAKAILLPLHTFSILSGLTRLSYRYRTHRLWWDDFWALVALLCDCLMVVAYIVRNASEKDPRRLNILNWITVITFTSTLWAARLSIALTIVRLVNPGRSRMVAKTVAGFLVLMWFGLLVQKFFICGGHGIGISVEGCRVTRQTGILELCTDITADLWLICSPIYLLWGAKLAPRRQTVIFSVFASDALTAAASIVHVYFIFKQDLTGMYISSYVEVAISLLICNLLVLVTWAYGRFFPEDGNSDSDSKYYNARQPITNYDSLLSTEVELESISGRRSSRTTTTDNCPIPPPRQIHTVPITTDDHVLLDSQTPTPKPIPTLSHPIPELRYTHSCPCFHSWKKHISLPSSSPNQLSNGIGATDMYKSHILKVASMHR